jgi:hypothetical protein
MVCSIADNTPLKKLEIELNLPPRCHGKRRECIHGFETQDGDFVMGLPGTALGYCQALFNNTGHPTTHTEKVMRLLSEIEAPWSNSHELFWGYRGAETPSEYLEQGIKPLLGTGRVPILITGLDPGASRSELEAIMATSPAIPQNETVLVRTVLTDGDSLKKITIVLRDLLAKARATKTMPKWWPLLQGNLRTADWERLRDGLGTDWDYVNVAVNPFVSDEAFELFRDQITVAQIPVGFATGIRSDGNIHIPAEMKITGATKGGGYSLPEFATKLYTLRMPPALIILGPTQPGYSDVDNQKRLAILMPLLQRACDTLWQSLTPERRAAVWRMAA